VKNSALEAQKYDFQVSTIRSRRLPHFQFSALGGELLQPFDFTFAKGVFGTYPGVGPIPSTEAKVHTPAKLTAFLTGGMDVPLSQEYKRWKRHSELRCATSQRRPSSRAMR